MTSSATMLKNPRADIYYWKCDRPAAFHGTCGGREGVDLIETRLAEIIRERFPDVSISFHPAKSQGNHITWLADIGGCRCFIRVENGPERDDYIEVESRVMSDVRALGISTPEVIAVDASRARAPFAWQVLEYIDRPDLNRHFKDNRLNFGVIAREIGAGVARWQAIQPVGFGPFDSMRLKKDDRLVGFHPSYRDYFYLRLDTHLAYLVDHQFLESAMAQKCRQLIKDHDALLDLQQGCLVHKDLALWNILGTCETVAAFIDWDDAIAGDPMDDLSLLGCFHNGAVVRSAMDGYAAIRPLTSEYRRRFWLHLLRNMIVKAVIRVGAGYFDRGDSFFLINTGETGLGLRAFTHARIEAAVDGLNENREVESL